jgi:TatD DNase family protein
MDLIDIGLNLTHDSFDPDRDAVVERAIAAGVSQFVLTGSSVAGSERAIRLAATRPRRFFATAGVHPHHAKEFDRETLPALSALTASPHCVAIGECGLDFFRNFSTPEQQEHAYREQLMLAARTKLPVFLHQRDAHAHFVGILKEHLNEIPRAVAHCFTGSADELATYLELGLYIGITGWICDERRGHHLQEIVGEIPRDRIMVETDAPYLLPRDLDPKPKSRRNEPVYLPHVLLTVARAMNCDPEELGAATTANARRFFAVQPPG